VWTRDPAWRLPPLWRSEFLNVLVNSVRAGIIGEEQSLKAWEVAISLFGRNEEEPHGPEVLRTALRHRISAYDAQYVALAERLGVILVTGDRRLREACPDLAMSIEDFARA
jgi:predicted nucleic acid-binding protein